MTQPSDQAEPLVPLLLAAWESPFATEYDHRHLLKQAADRILHLRQIVLDYTEICALSAREIKALREAASVRPDGRSGPGPSPEAPDYELPSYRTLGASTWTGE